MSHTVTVATVARSMRNTVCHISAVFLNPPPHIPSFFFKVAAHTDTGSLPTGRINIQISKDHAIFLSNDFFFLPRSKWSVFFHNRVTF